MSKKIIVLITVGSLAIGAGLGYYFGYDAGFERAASIIEKQQ